MRDLASMVTNEVEHDIFLNHMAEHPLSVVEGLAVPKGDHQSF
jgi:hypothetical protein